MIKYEYKNTRSGGLFAHTYEICRNFISEDSVLDLCKSMLFNMSNFRILNIYNTRRMTEYTSKKFNGITYEYIRNNKILDGGCLEICANRFRITKNGTMIKFISKNTIDETLVGGSFNLILADEEVDIEKYLYVLMR